MPCFFARRAELAYGDVGVNELITPGAVLIFELDLIEVKGAAAKTSSETAATASSEL